ncbi:NAD(+) diphosphatase [Luteimonas sp. RD2P54]|uniref:NAD(+) diphosphatase n=1 Tax=Luteimonas endophytica TaxID=3042023 RepID=A0ABT6JDK1_9GAMM|nr:NAD(+) diphosphatase [Luteimonas endophytica]MDH5824894.1 NAD(+) diphosphatase [Luteimonas endophytica]
MPFAFVGGALDRAEHLRNDAAAIAALWPRARVLLLDDDGCALADAQRQPYPPPAAALATVDPATAVFLGLHGGQGWFALPAGELAAAAPERIDLRTAAAAWPVMEATAFAQARAVLHWRARQRHCGACGGALRFARAGWLGHCAPCGLEHYPRTDPAVIVAVSDGERLLLGRQAGWPPRRWSVLAGFVEPGETLEQTVAREVFEESRVRVRASRYLASQPWPFPGSLMLGFEADAEPDEPVVNDELEDARWFTREQVGAALRGETRDDGLLLSPRISISRWLVERWWERR